MPAALLCLGAGAFRLLPLCSPLTAVQVKSPSFHSVRFTDREGGTLQEVLSRSESQALRVPLGEVSPYLRQAMVAVEDRRFYRHGGVDFAAVARALLQNIRARQAVSGGSTITLQLARMLQPAPRTIASKLRECFRAWRIEAGMTKEEILEEYLNRLPMGGNIYGVEAASRAYFGVAASELSLAQAAFLAAIPNSPTRLHPYRHRENVRPRQQHVLKRMAAEGFIAKERVEPAGRERVSVRAQETVFTAPHFVFHLMEGLPPVTRQVDTTIDSDLQLLLAHEVFEAVERLRPRRVTNAAAVLLDTPTGEVLAYVGSADFFDGAAGGQNDGVRALRQPGSALKPFLYGLAFERGYTPASLLADVPLALPMPEGVYRPKNYGETFLGPVRARVALASSLNVPAVRLVGDLGVSAFLEKLRGLGFTSLDRDADHYGAGLPLGSGEVRLLELAGAYRALAAGGETAPLREVRALDGRPPEAGPPPSRQALDPRAAFLVAQVLSDRFARASAFGVDSILALPFHCAVKTGTSFRFTDSWAAGFTGDYTLAVWVGNFDGSPMQELSGASGAGPLFAAIMTGLYEGREEPHRLPRPAGLADVSVCALSGRAPVPSCPRTVAEIVPQERLAEILSLPCDMHLEGSTRYPPPFAEWAREAGLAKSPAAVPGGRAGAPGFAISRPSDGSIFRRLPDLSPEYQSVLFELTDPRRRGEVEWRIDGEPLVVTSPPHRVLWRARPGEHRLTARTRTDSDSVVFSVR